MPKSCNIRHRNCAFRVWRRNFASRIAQCQISGSFFERKRKLIFKHSNIVAMSAEAYVLSSALWFFIVLLSEYSCGRFIDKMMMNPPTPPLLHRPVNSYAILFGFYFLLYIFLSLKKIQTLGLSFSCSWLTGETIIFKTYSSYKKCF